MPRTNFAEIVRPEKYLKKGKRGMHMHDEDTEIRGTRSDMPTRHSPSHFLFYHLIV